MVVPVDAGDPGIPEMLHVFLDERNEGKP